MPIKVIKIYDVTNSHEAEHLKGKPVLVKDIDANFDCCYRIEYFERINKHHGEYVFACSSMNYISIADFEHTSAIISDISPKIESLMAKRSDAKVKCPQCSTMVDNESLESHARMHSCERFSIPVAQTAFNYNFDKCVDDVNAWRKKQMENLTFDEKLAAILSISGCETKEELARWAVCGGELDMVDTEVTIYLSKKTCGCSHGWRGNTEEVVICQEHALGNVTDKKLKPVDENCLYKKVSINIREQLTGNWFGAVLIDLLPYASVCYVGDMGSPHILILENNTQLRRMPGYDYGDGGNYS